MSAPIDATRLCLFPGQGSITGSSALAWRSCASWSMVEQVSDAANLNVADLLLNSTDDEIVRTDRAQLATFTLSLIGWNELCLRHAAPLFLAGHSLGEFSSLVAGGVISLEDGARLVAARGQAMATASESPSGAMVALMGGDDSARSRLEELSEVWLANVNGPGQVVMSGTRVAVESLIANARDLGWRRATLLNVGGAFHSPLMSPAQSVLDEVLASVTFHESDHRIASNVDGRWRAGGDEWRDLLSRQLTSAVQFLLIATDLDASVSRVIEMPPAGVLVGLIKRIRDFDELQACSEPEVN